MDLVPPNREQSEQTEGQHPTVAHDEAPLDTAQDSLSVPAKNGSKASPAKHNSEGKSKFSSGLRLYGSEERMWQVAAGHGPDHAKVSAYEFVCLSIIAARGPKGILQPDLVNISGQDKRSLPKRTDRLHKNGYIEKRPVLVHGNRTSLCTLKRFVTTASIVDHASFSAGESTSSRVQKGHVLDLLSLTNGIFENLRDLEIIATEDLKKKLVCRLCHMDSALTDLNTGCFGS